MACANFAGFQKDNGCHDINQALYYSDEILAMKDGNLLATGAPEEIITAELVEEIYEVPLELREVDGKPFVLPV